MPARAVHQVLAEAFVAEGATTVFGLMGDGNKRWMLDMVALGVRVVHCRHEGAAAAMADGFARAGAGVGVCAVTYGPGVSQLSTSLLVAAKHGTAMVVFAADVEAAARDTGGQLDVDARALLAAAGASVRRVRLPGRAADDVHAAFAEARSAQRPVALLAAVDVQELLVPADEPGEVRGTRGSTIAGSTIAGSTIAGSTIRTPGTSVNLPRTMPDAATVAGAAAALAGARRVVVLAGQGAVRSGARRAVDALAQRLDAVVTTTFGAKGWLDDHPRFVGVAGGFALDATRAVLHQADWVVAVGASLNAHTTDHGRLFGNARVVRIDARPGAGWSAERAADVELVGDAAATVAALVDALDRGSPAPGAAAGWRTEVLAPVLRADPRLAQLRAQPVDVEPGTLDPRALMLALDRTLPDDAVVVVGGGHCMAFAAQYLQNRSGRRAFHLVFDFMTTGQAVPAAIGAAVACPSRMVVAVEGDASVLMHVQELETAARSGIGLLVVVVNDGALGAEYHKLAALGLDPSEALAPTPDLAAVAAALGGRGRSVTDEHGAGELARWFDASTGPHLADCTVSRRVVGPL